MNREPSVARVWRYPVKSMLGHTAAAVDVSAVGVAGDRQYALRDAAGRLGSGKTGGRFGRIPGLFRFTARREQDRVVVALPDGREIAADSADIDAVLSECLGQAVTLLRADDGSHFDSSPLHLLTTASLAWLERTLPGVRCDERRFRPNLLLSAGHDGPIEQDWIGAELEIGDTAVLRVTEPTRRCGMVAEAQEDLPADPRVLRHISRNADLFFGVYAEVLVPGRIHAGDPVRVNAAHPASPDSRRTGG